MSTRGFDGYKMSGNSLVRHKALKRRKYNTKRIFAYGVMHDSQLEIERHKWLDVLVKSGVIQNLVYHPGRIRICADVIGYEPDFSYTEGGTEYYEDTKGVIGERFKLLMRLWPKFGPRPLRVVKAIYRRISGERQIVGWCTVKTIVPEAKP